MRFGLDGGLFRAAREALILYILRYGFLDFVLLPDLHLASIRGDALPFEGFLWW